MPSVKLALALSSLVSLAVGCGGEPPAVHRTPAPLTVSNGWTYTGISYLGYSVQSVAIPTTSSYALYESSPSTSVDPVAGLGPNGTSYSGAMLSVSSSDLSLVEGNVAPGGILDAQLDNGQSAEIRFVGSAQGLGPRPEVLYFLLEVRATGGAWTPLCGLDAAGAPKWAIVLPGAWDHSVGQRKSGEWSDRNVDYSFACQGSSITKCVEFGYGLDVWPDYAMPSIELLTCVRALRADYCGDGTSWTENGRLLDLWDYADILTQAKPDWKFEAIWEVNGAICISSPRLALPDGVAVPRCMRKKLRDDCGLTKRGDPVVLTQDQLATSYAPVP